MHRYSPECKIEIIALLTYFNYLDLDIQRKCRDYTENINVVNHSDNGNVLV